MEIERKFKVSKIIDNLESYPYHTIEQVYLESNPEVRVRKQDDDFIFTYKDKTDSSLAREEYNLTIPEELYVRMKRIAIGNIISKRRYLIPYDNYTIELDVFNEPFSPLIIAEVEFESIEAAEKFNVPDWFGEDVTGQKKYKNSYMSIQGFNE